MIWQLVYLPEAINDLEKLDGSVRPGVVKGIVKVSQNPDTQGYGKPLGNKAGIQLAGLMKIKFKGAIRVVYKLVHEETTMKVIVVSARADDEVYRQAAVRRRKYDL